MALVAKYPDDAVLQRRMATACFLAGLADDGTKYLKAALAKDTEQGVVFLDSMIRNVPSLPLEARKLAVQKSCPASQGARCLPVSLLAWTCWRRANIPMP